MRRHIHGVVEGCGCGAPVQARSNRMSTPATMRQSISTPRKTLIQNTAQLTLI
jgi:hypothetical protein